MLIAAVDFERHAIAFEINEEICRRYGICSILTHTFIHSYTNICTHAYTHSAQERLIEYVLSTRVNIPLLDKEIDPLLPRDSRRKHKSGGIVDDKDDSPTKPSSMKFACGSKKCMFFSLHPNQTFLY